MSNVICQYLAKQKYETPSNSIYSHIDEWLEWYQGDVKKFHRYKIYNGTSIKSENRYRLGMAKKVCEDWANLLLNEKVAIKAGKFNKRLNKILQANNFLTRANQLIELTFALGTGAFVEYKDASGGVTIDYIRADMIYPLSWDNGDISECAFGSIKVVDGKERIYLQIHRLGKADNGENTDLYYIENKYVDAESGEELEEPEEIETIVETGSSAPLFQIITPNICNNIDLDSPLGVSVYGNSIDQLKGCDIVYDSYMNEFVLGRKRVLVPMSMAKMEMTKDGIKQPTFDPDDTVFYQIPQDRAGDFKITEIDMNIRAQEHDMAMQRNLDILSFKCGLGAGRYKFEAGGVKTATEVISDKSDLYQNRQKNAIIINHAIVNMVSAICFLDNGGNANATVDFDDSIIEDTNTTIDKNIKMVDAGLRSKITAIMEINKCSKSDAEKELKRIAEDNQITGQDIDWTDFGKDKEKDDVKDESPEEPADGGKD